MWDKTTWPAPGLRDFTLRDMHKAFWRFCPGSQVLWEFEGRLLCSLLSSSTQHFELMLQGAHGL